ncbi:hypothetical protein [Dyadobacter aurulentus]|uniref:hypothetical protein n=1 Tax=Dyadobacter sp. UC 10 TaxID=2605428 RepID=UPI0011F0C102|nr:hypothetical protein [Dyadobacter sp. UC 10]KAA0993319.1 hypothetical protein FXO21_25650 [Dyadobacter sp. UC 10]
MENEDFEAFKTSKTIPRVIEEQVLKALSFYPELKETEIHFLFKKKIKGSVMQAQPKISTMFGGKRAYHINISALFQLTNSAIPIHQIPPDIMVGWIGHELGHVMDYENRNTMGMIRFGLGYLFSTRFVKQAERVADTFAVNHGLGRYILKTKHFILDHASLSEKYKQKIARLYLSPDDIVEQVRKLEAEERGNPS